MQGYTERRGRGDRGRTASALLGITHSGYNYNASLFGEMEKLSKTNPQVNRTELLYQGHHVVSQLRTITKIIEHIRKTQPKPQPNQPNPIQVYNRVRSSTGYRCSWLFRSPDSENISLITQIIVQITQLIYSHFMIYEALSRQIIPDLQY